MFDHFDGFRDLVNVTRHADHIEHAVFGWDNVIAPIALAAGVGHGCEFQPGGCKRVVADDPPHIGFLAVPPWAEFGFWKLGGRVFVADFHVIDPSRHASLIDPSNLGVGELGIVDEAPVADGAVEHFQFGAVGYPGCFIAHEVDDYRGWDRIASTVLADDSGGDVAKISA